jgi:hypothetical protein
MRAACPGQDAGGRVGVEKREGVVDTPVQTRGSTDGQTQTDGTERLTPQ